MDETVVPGTRRCVTLPKRCAWRLTQAANKTQMATATSGPTTCRAATATPATTPPLLGPDPLRRPPPTIGSFANGRFPRRDTAVRNNFNFATDTILTNHYHDPGHTKLCVLCEDAKLLLRSVTKRTSKN